MIRNGLVTGPCWCLTHLPQAIGGRGGSRFLGLGHCPCWEQDQEPVPRLSQGPERPSDVNDFWHRLAWVRLKPVTQKGRVGLSPAAAPGSHPALPRTEELGKGRHRGLPINIHRSHRRLSPGGIKASLICEL